MRAAKSGSPGSGLAATISSLGQRFFHGAQEGAKTDAPVIRPVQLAGVVGESLTQHLPRSLPSCREPLDERRRHVEIETAFSRFELYVRDAIAIGRQARLKVVRPIVNGSRQVFQTDSSARGYRPGCAWA